MRRLTPTARQVMPQNLRIGAYSSVNSVFSVVKTAIRFYHGEHGGVSDAGSEHGFQFRLR